MKITIKHDNAYANACVIQINVITFVSRLNHRTENAIRKKRNEQKNDKKQSLILFQDQEYDEY
jgi:hypothetical protein